MMNCRVFVTLLLVASLASAQDPAGYKPVLSPAPQLKVQPIPEGDDVIVVVTQGQPAPMSGQLFSNETALRWGNYLHQYKTQVPLLLETQRHVCLAEIQYRDEVLKVRSAAAEEVREDYMERLKRLEHKNAELQGELSKGPKFLESRGFGIMLGVVGTLGLTAISVWAISAAAGK